MSTKRVLIESEERLEGILREGSTRGGIVICHPHPLYGGSMYNNVVDAIDKGFSAKGYTSLRFNFRGVGDSSGSYDEGRGEVVDVLASLQFLRSLLDKDARVVLAGYSFGAWVSSMAAAKDQGIDALFLVSFPFAFYRPDELRAWEKAIYFVGGTYDDIAPANDMIGFYKELPTVEKWIKILPTDHFYGGKDQEIVEFIGEQIEPIQANTR